MLAPTLIAPHLVPLRQGRLWFATPLATVLAVLHPAALLPMACHRRAVTRNRCLPLSGLALPKFQQP